MILQKNHTDYERGRIPGIVCSKKGSLLAYYECRKAPGDWAQIDLKVARSTDDGKTWETVLLIPGNGETLNNPVLIAHGETVHFLHCRNYKKLYHCVSTDDGKTFSQIRDVSSAFEELDRPYTVAAIGPGHGIVHNGNLLIPAWFAWNPENVKAHWPSFIASVYSGDNGETWHCGEVLDESLLINPSECAFAVTADGQILNSIRNENPERIRAIAYSPDGFSRWSKPVLEPNLPDPICQGSMDHREGKIFHINCRGLEDGRILPMGSSNGSRRNLTVNITEDGFKTVSSIFVDEIGGYSDLVVTEDSIFVLYERNFKEEGLRFVKLPR